MTRATVSLVIAAFVFSLTNFAPGAKAELAPVTTFWGLSLGQPEEEAERLKGISTTHVISGPACWGSDTSAPFTETWSYQSDGGVYRVNLRDHKIWSVIFYANKGVAPEFLVGALGDTQGALEAKLGPPSTISVSQDGSARWIAFEKYSVAYQLQNDSVIMFGIYDPMQGLIRFCD
jgi:hypothetical protein